VKNDRRKISWKIKVAEKIQEKIQEKRFRVNKNI
jgi:hypothetical protein